MHASMDDDEDDQPCYRHPGRLTALACVTCERPVCVDCAIAAPVGFKCPDHARTTRAERAAIPAARLARGVVAAAVVAVALGALLAAVRLPFEIILAWLAGMAVGEAARRASGGFRGGGLARAAMVAAAVGVGAPALLLLLAGATPGAWLAFQLLGAAAAAYGAWGRAA